MDVMKNCFLKDHLPIEFQTSKKKKKIEHE